MAVVPTYTVGVLALQGAFVEHIALLKRAAAEVPFLAQRAFVFLQVRNEDELGRCDALVVPGGESTTLSLVASRTGLLEPLRTFVNVDKKPTWGTCAGLILLAEKVDGAKEGGQLLVGGLDVRVHRNHFGRQIDSFEGHLKLDFLAHIEPDSSTPPAPFPAVFIRAPVVSELIDRDGSNRPPVRVLGRVQREGEAGDGDIVAVEQGHVFGTSFHPELTDDIRIHAWWLQQAVRAIEASRTA